MLNRENLRDLETSLVRFANIIQGHLECSLETQIGKHLVDFIM